MSDVRIALARPPGAPSMSAVARNVVAGAATLVGAVMTPSVSMAQPGQAIVFAAASLQTALDAIAARYRTETGNEVVIAYAGTPALARQIEQGAPADIFISADREWMDYLAQRNLIRADTRINLLGNRLVLVGPRTGTVPAEITPTLDLIGMLGGGRLAVADTATIPAGRYARAALESLGLWASVEAQLAQVENVRAALALVARGEAPLGIVYYTDDNAERAVRMVGVFPEETHPPIIYPAAALTMNPIADQFLAYLRSRVAMCLFELQGFTVLANEETDLCRGVVP